MPDPMTTAERRGYRQICLESGPMLVVAADQRGGMRKVLAETDEAREAITNDMLGDVKAGLVSHLANPGASCILLDAACAVPRVVDEDVLGRDTALLIGLDASGYDETEDGFRLSRLVPDMPARRVREMGATGSKIMVYLRPDREGANGANMRILQGIIADHAGEDLLLVSEFLTYRLPGESAEDYAAAFPDLIVEGCRMCLDAGAKLLKIPYPGNAGACERVTELCGDVPWAVLSAGVDHETFVGQVRTSMEAGASGVIAGRALWKDCISLDPSEQERRLTEIALTRLRELRAIVEG